MTKHKGVMEENDLAIYIFDDDHEGFCSTMIFPFPAKIGGGGKINLQKRTSYWLYLSLKPAKTG
jgi:hypothetical protein